MDNDDIGILKEIGVMLNGLNQQYKKKTSRIKRMLSKTNPIDGWLPSIQILPANMSFIDEEKPLIIECHVKTSDAATVLIKHNGEIIHEQHIP